MKKMAILTVTPEALRTLLGLPDAVELVRIELAPGLRGVMKLMIEGAGWDTPEGGFVQSAGAGVVFERRDENGKVLERTMDWGLPKDEAAAA